jgi:hypothetical protein
LNEKEKDALKLADIALQHYREGGAGSGHYGHQGVPGSRGGSAPSAFVQRIIQKLPRKLRPNLNSIKVEDKGQESSMYDPSTGNISVNSDRPDDLIHEIGHKLFEENLDNNSKNSWYQYVHNEDPGASRASADELFAESFSHAQGYTTYHGSPGGIPNQNDIKFVMRLLNNSPYYQS